MLKLKMSGRGWAYVGVTLGAGVSIAANVAHSYVPPDKAPHNWTPPTGAILGAIFWPVALFVALEILARINWPSDRRWIALRCLGLLPVALVAAVVSYLHMSGLLAYYDEDNLTVTFGPLAVDGLMVMSTGALIATGRTSSAVFTPEPATVAVTRPATVASPAPDTAPDTKPARVRTSKRTPRPAKAREKRTSAAAQVAALRAAEPDITQAVAATRLGVSGKTVQRYWHRDTGRINGTPVVPDTAAPAAT